MPAYPVCTGKEAVKWIFFWQQITLVDVQNILVHTTETFLCSSQKVG